MKTVETACVSFEAGPSNVKDAATRMQPQTHSHCRHHGYACFMPLVRIRQHTTRVCVKKHRQDRRGCSTPYSVLFGVSFGLQQTPPLPQHSLKWRTQHRKGSAPGVTLRVCMVLPGPAPCLHIWCPDLPMRTTSSPHAFAHGRPQLAAQCHTH